MQYSRTLLFGAALFGLLPGLPALALPGAAAVPADSFIDAHVDTVPQLTQQVTLDPIVRRRLARHFHTSGPAVVKYIQNNLVLKRTKAAQTYQVYCIARDGREYTIHSRLPAGTPIFVLRTTGQAVLKLACGNPMIAALPPVTTKVGGYQSPQIAQTPKTVVPAAAPALIPNGPVLLAGTDTSGVLVQPVGVDVSPSFQALIPHGGGGFPLGFLAAIPVIAGLSSHHSGGGSTPTIPAGTTGTGTGTGTSGTGTSGTGTSGTGTSGTGTSGTGTSGTGTSGTGTSGTGTSGTNNLGTTGNNSGTTTGGTNTGGVTPVPEPSGTSALVLGGLGLALLTAGARRGRRRNSRKA